MTYTFSYTGAEMDKILTRTPVAKAKIPLSLPTADGEPSVTHPDVVLFDEPWNGYRYWMAYTPYPDAARENPHIAASNNGVDWEEPAGITNPIVTLSEVQADGYTYNSDTDLVITPDNKLRCYYRLVGTAIFYKESADGVSWGAAVETNLSSTESANLMSPAIVYDQVNSIYKMWVINFPLEGLNELNQYESADGITWTGPTACSWPDYNIWHLDVIYIAGKYHALFCGDPTERSQSHLFYSVSDDGVTWTGSTLRAVPLSGYNFDSARHYRSTFVPVPSEDVLRFDVWASGIPQGYDDGGTYQSDPWLIGYFKGIDLTKSQEQIFIPATDFIASVNMATADLDSHAGSRWPAWEMSGGDIVEQINTSARIPAHWLNGCDIYVVWCSLSSSTGDVRLVVDCGNTAQGESFEAQRAGINAATSTTQGDNIRVDTYIREIPKDDSELWHIRVKRDSGNAEDTLTGSIGIVGLVLRRKYD